MALGMGSKDFDAHPNPTPVDGVSGAVSVVVGGAYSCALLSDASVTCWGTFGSFSSLTPAPLGLTNVAMLSAGWTFLCAALNDGTARCVGQIDSGIEGDVGLKNVVSVAAGDDASCAVVEDGSVYCWGRNSYGAAGNGTYGPITAPVRVF